MARRATALSDADFERLLDQVVQDPDPFAVARADTMSRVTSYFVLGDDRDDSLDSRYFGFIRRADIVGSPVLIYGSYNLPADPSGQTPTVLQMRWNRLLKRL